MGSGAALPPPHGTFRRVAGLEEKGKRPKREARVAGTRWLHPGWGAWRGEVTCEGPPRLQIAEGRYHHEGAGNGVDQRGEEADYAADQACGGGAILDTPTAENAEDHPEDVDREPE